MASKAKMKRAGWTHESLIERHAWRGPGSADEGRRAEVHVHLGKTAEPPKAWRVHFPHAQPNAAVRISEAPDGPKILVSPLASIDVETDPRLRASPFARVRDAVGQAVGQLEKLDVAHAAIDLALPAAQVPAAVLGLELALYRYKRFVGGQTAKLRLTLSHLGKPLASFGEGATLGQAVNLARHLVNMPPNELDPVNYAILIQTIFAGVKNVSVEVWDEKRLEKENCNLHLAVGLAAAAPPRLLKISYRPPGATAKVAPLALVGKGITFDTGGLDIKPAAGMRLMKKDMGGSAAVIGTLYWAARTNCKEPLEAYLPLAENAIGSKAFRPGDIVTARSGMTVEIHNTDAEGRLVLADAMDVAIKELRKPRAIIDVATLTGAIKVALGANLAGLFATDEKLSGALSKAGTATGDLTWPMPLVQRYRAQSNSNFADCVNAVDGFGGAITAALFLERFAGDVPWAHLDIYAWKDGADGAWLEGGGSGQGVMLLAEYLSRA